jgi:hypothetical protein
MPTHSPFNLIPNLVFSPSTSHYSTPLYIDAFSLHDENNNNNNNNNNSNEFEANSHLEKVAQHTPSSDHHHHHPIK